MKTKIKIKQIEDKDINVIVNDAAHTIEQIKKELKMCFQCGYAPCRCKAEVLEMWEE